MAIVNANIGLTANAVYTSTGNTVVSLMYFCNFSGSTKIANLYLVPSTQSSAGAQNYNQVYANYAITSSDTLVANQEKFVLGNGDAIYANANAATAMTMTIGYFAL
jgi:hypothetical protein